MKDLSIGDRMQQIKLKNTRKMTIDADMVLCQYNPDRYEIWKKYCGKQHHFGNPYDTLHIANSPHVDFLLKLAKKGFMYFSSKNWESATYTNYYKLQRDYGKDHTTTCEKMSKFIEMLRDIKLHGVKELPDVLVEPIDKKLKQEYEFLHKPLLKHLNKYEIYEGHHRLAILFCFRTQTLVNLNEFDLC